jgi:prepilin-type N-terminal cleavage/methylation domain-containing protein
MLVAIIRSVAMKGSRIKSGFSLVEVMVAIAITSIVMTGVVVTFSRVTKSAENAELSSAITNTSRGLADILRSDFTAAGKGFSDLKALDIHFRFHQDYYVYSSPIREDKLMYGITDLFYNVSNTTSEITFHYFDYDIRENPTFIFHTNETWGEAGTTTYNEGYVISTDLEALDKIKGVKDGIWLIYKYDWLVKTADDGETIWNTAPDDGIPLNHGIILQAGTTGDVETGTYADHYLGMDADTGDSLGRQMKLNFSDGPIFSNQLSGNAIETPLVQAAESVPAKLDRGASGNHYRFPTGYWLARYLGDAYSFNRVSYSIQRGSAPGDPDVLVREQNGELAALATEVEEFTVRIGIDSDVGVSPGSVTATMADGLISRVTEIENWTTGQQQDSRWSGLSAEEFKKILGRHAIQAEVTFTQASSQVEGDRSFDQVYRIVNGSLPLQVP